MWAGSRRLSSAWRARGSSRAELGLITLEWLLIVGAIAGIAASSVLAVQIAIDNSTDLPDRPDVRVVDAEIAAATVASEATEAMDANPGGYSQHDPDFKRRCEEVAHEYSDVVQIEVWVEPTAAGSPLALENPAKCRLTRLP